MTLNIGKDGELRFHLNVNLENLQRVQKLQFPNTYIGDIVLNNKTSQLQNYLNTISNTNLAGSFDFSISKKILDQYRIPIERYNENLKSLSLINNNLSVLLKEFARSQFQINKQLSDLARNVNLNTIRELNAVRNAINSASLSAINSVTLTKNWRELENLNQFVHSITESSEKINSSDTQLTKNDLTELQNNILESVEDLITKSKSEKVVNAIINFVAILGFILTIYSVKVQSADISNKELSILIEKQIDDLNSNFTDYVDSKNGHNLNLRQSKKDSLLLKNRKPTSLILSTIKKNQKVFELENNRKWLYVIYFDSAEAELKTGLVRKKYFKKI